MADQDNNPFANEADVARVLESLGVVVREAVPTLGNAIPTVQGACVQHTIVRVSNHSVAQPPAKPAGSGGPYRLTGLSNKSEALR